MPGALPRQILGKAVGACVEMIQPYARRAARLHFYTGTRARSLAFTRTARLMSSLGRRPEDNRDSRLETACFAHRYEDGDRDTGLKAKYVKPVDSGSDSDGSAKKDKLREGDKVTARYRGLEKYYKGVIRRAHSDGTYSIDCRRSVRRVHLLFIFHAICPRRRRRREGEPRQGALHQEAV